MEYNFPLTDNNVSERDVFMLYRSPVKMLDLCVHRGSGPLRNEMSILGCMD